MVDEDGRPRSSFATAKPIPASSSEPQTQSKCTAEHGVTITRGPVGQAPGAWPHTIVGQEA